MYCPLLFIQTWLFYLCASPCRFIIRLCSSPSCFWLFSHSGDNRNPTLLPFWLVENLRLDRDWNFSTLWKTKSISHFLSKIIKHMPFPIAAQESYCLTVAFLGVVLLSQYTYPFCAWHISGMHSEGHGQWLIQFPLTTVLPMEPCYRTPRVSSCPTSFFFPENVWGFLKIALSFISDAADCPEAQIYFISSQVRVTPYSPTDVSGAQAYQSKLVNSLTQYKVSASPIVS